MQGPDAAGARYSLLGVVVHQGSSMKTGHYFAYVHRTVSSSSTADSMVSSASCYTPNGVGNGLPDPTSLADASGSQLAKERISNGVRPVRDGDLNRQEEEEDHSTNSPVALGPADSSDLRHGANGGLAGACKAGISAAVEARITDGSLGAECLKSGGQEAEEAAGDNGSIDGGASAVSGACYAAERNSVAKGSGLSQSQKVWFFAGDTSVRKVAAEEVLACEAYLLLYQRLE